MGLGISLQMSSRKSLRKPRLFWLMMLAFTLVIGLGVCGMVSFIGLVIAGAVPAVEFHADYQIAPKAYATILSDYYIANNNSWSGVDQRIQAPPFAGSSNFYHFTVLDADGNRITTTNTSISGEPTRRMPPDRSAPIMAHGEQVGTLVLRQQWGFDGSPRMAPGAGFFNALRSFLVAGLLLSGALMALAIFFAQRLSRPLRNLTTAAETLAAGQLNVQVPGASVREMDELAGAFNRMAFSLAESDRQRRQMTADIAHELRTPLSIIKGRLEGLQDGVYQASPEEVERLLAETALLERLIDDLRLLALAEAGQLRLYREPTDPYELLEGVAQAFSAQAAEHEVTIRVLAACELPQLDADPQRIAQVLSNLVSNALRYTPGGGQIILSAHYPADDSGTHTIAEPEKDMLALTVSDTGQGIAPEDLPHVFDRFWRADRSRTRGSGGAGLGLAIVKQIVLAHDGTIGADSLPGKGTTIRMALPVVGV